MISGAEGHVLGSGRLSGRSSLISKLRAGERLPVELSDFPSIRTRPVFSASTQDGRLSWMFAYAHDADLRARAQQALEAGMTLAVVPDYDGKAFASLVALYR